MTQLFRRLKYLLHRKRFDQELADEMAFHREMSGGESGFGNSLQLREEAREAWGWMWIDRLGQDARYALRMLRKSPGFTCTAVGMLAVGIAVNVVAFGFYDLIVLTPLPVRDPASLVRFQRQGQNQYWSDMPYAEMVLLRDQAQTLSTMIGVKTALLSVEGEAKAVHVSFVSTNYFTELGGPVPIAGHMLNDSDTEPVAVISERFWQHHFGGDPSIAGKTVRFNGKPAAIAGVFSSKFSGLGLNNTDVFLPLHQQPYFVTGSKLLAGFPAGPNVEGLSVWGRLRPGVTAQAAESELQSIAQQLHQQYPNDIWDHETLPTQPGGFVTASMFGTSRGSGSPKDRSHELRQAELLGAAMGLLILAAACGNLGGLLLARGIARDREIAIRTAVGAGSARLTRQLFTESMILALLGSAVGLALGNALLRGLMAVTEVPAWVDPTPDWRVVAFSIAIAFLAAILFGLTPALQLARRRQRATFLRQALIAAQVAASCVLLIVAGLFVRAQDHAAKSDAGFNFERAISIDPGLDAHGYTPAAARDYLERLAERLRDVPGVASVSIASTAPLGHKSVVFGETVDGDKIDVHTNSVGPEYFSTMMISMLAGQGFTGPNSVIVSESLAKRHWRGQPALGKPIDFDDRKMTVVGIAGNAPLTALQDPDAVEAYFPAQTNEMTWMSLVVRTTGPADKVAPLVTPIAREVDPKIVPVVEVLSDSFRDKIQSAQQQAWLVSLLGASALALACVGIVGLIAYAVSQRTKEIGLRMALGASPIHVLGVVLRQFFRPIAIGLIAGVAGAAAMGQLLRRDLYGIEGLDPIAYFTAVSIFLTLALIAALIPARKALKIDPMTALRTE